MAVLEKACRKLRLRIAEGCLRAELRREWEAPEFAKPNERAIEFGFALRQLERYYPASVLDVGSGRTAWPAVLANCGFRVTAIDEMGGYWRSGFFNRHYYVQRDDITHPAIKGPFDFVTCLSVLEHIAHHAAGVAGIFQLLKAGGRAVLTFPYNESRYVRNVYELAGSGYGQEAPYICQVFSRQEVKGWLETQGGQIIEQRYYEVFTGELWTFGSRLTPPRQVECGDKHHLSCLLVEKRG